MVFRLLGKVVRRAWALVLLGWGLALLTTWLLAPPWDEVAVDREFAFLPADAPSRRAEEVFKNAFPDSHLDSSIVLVLHRTDTGRLDQDRAFIKDVLYPGLRNLAEAQGGLAKEPLPSDEPLFGDDTPAPPKKPARRSIMADIHTPDGLEGPLLVSADGRAQLVVVELTTEFLSKENWATITKIQDLVQDLRRQGKIPAGLDIAITGSAVVGRDHTVAELSSARATMTLTIVLVVTLLILIYRAPLLAIIPLGTVYLAVTLSLHLLAMLARAGHVMLFQGIEVYITILSYGAGVDYCLFLTARYKEELDRGAHPADAVDRAVAGVGGALTASAATVIGGIGMMLFAQFGKFREAGFAIPLTLILVWCATLTFSPALLRLAGRWAFWPQRPGQGTVASQPATASATGPGGWWFYRAGALEYFWQAVGRLLVRRPAVVWLVAVALMAPFAITAAVFHDRLSYDLIGELPGDTPSVVGTKVLQEHFPAGVMGPVTILAVHPQVDFGTAEGREIMKQLTERLKAQKEQLGLADIRTLTSPLGITSASAKPFGGPEVSQEKVQEVAREHYATALGGRTRIGTRLDLVLVQSPFDHRSIEDLEALESAVRAAFPAGLQKDLQLHVVGTTASVRDLATVTRQDRSRIQYLVLGMVLLILIALLRRWLISVYLLLSVLFSYYVTLGVSFLVFWLLDPQGFVGINWKVAIFLFTILIAVGEDYNIFLLARIHEEEKRHGPIEGITHALSRTGPIISSCGIIMAGTFASLLAGSLTELKQLGFALAFGILLDTFIVRPILVPAFLILVNSGRLPLPNRQGKGSPPVRAELAPRAAGDA